MNQVVNEDLKMLAIKASGLILEAIESFAEQEKIVLGLVGGRSVVSTYDELSKKDSLAWKKIHFVILDERVVPLDSDESNFKLIKEHLLNPLIERNQINMHNVHPFYNDKENINESLDDYTKIFIDDGDKVDVAVLSSGEDGHIAAIYPNKKYDNDKHFIYMNDSPKPPSKRITSTPKVIGSSRIGFVFFIGEAKRDALKFFLDGTQNTPANALRKINNLTLITDLK